jgi:hypothetical protein
MDSASEQKKACYGPVEASFPNGSAANARSMVHADALYLLAQAVGLDARVAYFIGAYGDTPDKNDEFILMVPDSGGNFIRYQDAEHATIALPDLSRNYDIGVGIHFPLVKSQPQITVDPSDTVNEGVSRLRSWIFGDQSGSFPDPCLGGVTVQNTAASSYFSGAECYVSTSAFSFSGGAYDVNQAGNISSYRNYQSGDQPFQSAAPLKGISANDSPVFAGDLQGALNGSSGRLLDGVTPVPLALLQIGVYLHSLMDRVSHWVALTPMMVSGPPTALLFKAQVMFGFSHAYLHFEEVGIPVLSPRTETALNLAYDELCAFAAKHPEFMAGTPRITAKASVVPPLVNSVLNQRSATNRLGAMATLSQNLGYAYLTQANLP